MRTAHQLKANQIDLAVTALSKDDCYFRNEGHGILYRQGILFTAGTGKGEALFTFCEKIGYAPPRVVFINDKETHLADIEVEAEKRGC